ncbi:DUF2971 domain-containing protein [Dermacoccus abyssi]|uniref:DUF2971 domain-containing protein n=1 Tax=Dermacoccus abyssi TaxID=322596 RepID=UPI002AD2C1C4|nr:DUF2971 domain-containing protein [Dermacoccus abyssi]
MTSNSPTPETIWHYTTAHGLRVILKSKAFFATATPYLNDSQELTFGKRQIRAAGQVLVDKLGGKTEDDDRPAGGWNLWATLNSPPSSQEDEDPWEVPSTYTTSFSSEGDMLSQWRAYGGERGFAIGVDLRKFESSIPSHLSPKISGVRYGMAGQNLLTEEMEKRLVTHKGSRDLDANGISELLEFLAQIKHPAFKEEKEVRLQVSNPPRKEIKARVRGDSFVTYVEVPFDPSAVTHVRVGPGRMPHQTRAVTQMLADLSYRRVRVDESEAPYRA